MSNNHTNKYLITALFLLLSGNICFIYAQNVVNRYGQLNNIPELLPHTRMIVTKSVYESNDGTQLVYFTTYIADSTSGKIVVILQKEYINGQLNINSEGDSISWQQIIYKDNRVDRILFSNYEYNTEFVYNKDGDLVKTWVDGYPVKYTYSPDGYIEKLFFEDGVSLWVARKYRKKGNIVTEKEYSGFGGAKEHVETTIYTYNNYGSVVKVSDKDGTKYFNYKYDELGNVIYQEGYTYNKNVKKVLWTTNTTYKYFFYDTPEKAASKILTKARTNFVEGNLTEAKRLTDSVITRIESLINTDSGLVYMRNATLLRDSIKIHELFQSANSKMTRNQYSDALKLFEQALSVNPNIPLLRDSIQLYLEKCHKEKNEAHVRLIVDKALRGTKDENNFGKTEEMLRNAIDTAKAYNYSYKEQELSAKLDEILTINTLLNDSTKPINIQLIEPDYYKAMSDTLLLELGEYLKQSEKTIRKSRIQLTLCSEKRYGRYDLSSHTKTLKTFCREYINKTYLKPFYANGSWHKTLAKFNYEIEYAKYPIEVYLRNGESAVYAPPELDNELKQNTRSTMSDRINSLPVSCNGKYFFSTTSMTVNKETEVSFKLQKTRFRNGPQNAWLSFLVPGWGDKYVSEHQTFNLWATTISYGFIGAGLYCILNPVYDSTYHYGYDYHNEWVITNKNERLGKLMIASGAIIWVADIIYVWVKGSKNKKNNFQRVRLHFSNLSKSSGVTFKF